MNGSWRTQTCLSRLVRSVMAAGCVVVFGWAAAEARQSSAPAQSPANPSQQSSPAQPAPASDRAEMNTRDSTIPLESHVNLVPVRVIVRDSKGHPVGNLRKEDFQLFEDGKLQDISHFSVETPESVSQTFVRPDPVGGAPELSKPADFIPPSRFVALLFDDVNITVQDLLRTRQAATQFVDSAVQPTDRVAVFTISGQSQMDFTADRDKLHAALLGLMVRPVAAGNSTGIGQCPPIDYYEANLIQNNLDPSALTVATQDTLACAFENNPSFLGQAQQLAMSSAVEVYETGQVQTESAFRRLEEVIRRISALPGQRTLVLLSPGFIYPTREYDLSQIIDRADRSNVFINTLDARGLYVPDLGDISEPDSGSVLAAGPRSVYRIQAQSAETDVLMILADSTGGMAFRNNNDLAGGLRMIGAAPEFSYLLAFTPHNFKFDGRFHSLKVTLLTKEHVTIQTRRGFYAPKHSVSVEEAVKQEIEEALFSQDVQRGLPVELHTQYYKVDSADAKLAVLTHVDLSHLRFQKAAGRNQESLTIVTALFDRDGNIITGIKKTVDMRLLDTTLERLSRTGVTVKTSFDVKPGDYVVRIVVRDSNTAQLSAENGAVEIPY
jgi:VWFA-related protein